MRLRPLVQPKNEFQLFLFGLIVGASVIVSQILLLTVLPKENHEALKITLRAQIWLLYLWAMYFLHFGYIWNCLIEKPQVTNTLLKTFFALVCFLAVFSLFISFFAGSYHPCPRFF
jgi:hypothetical protein